MKDYILLLDTDAGRLADAINSWLRDGWKLYGNLVVGPGNYLYQAMIKE